MRRRDFIAGLGGAAAWPLAARAQQADRVRRIVVLQPGDENDPVSKTQVSAFTQAFAGLGWTDGRNVRMDLRWAGDDRNRIRALAHELVGLKPDIILANSTAVTAALQRETRTIPIVFVNAGDPVASGIVPGLNQPGGNITGFGRSEASMGGKWLELLSEIAPGLKRAAFMFNPYAFASYEPTLGGKWLELLSQIAPGLKRAAIMFNPDTAPVSTYMPSFETAARSLKVVPIIAPVRSDVEIEAAIRDIGSEPGGGLVVTWDAFMFAHRVPIISAAARNNVPAVYNASDFVRDGGLLSYGADLVDNFRRAAIYVDRILRGAKPGDLPVQFPTKFEMVLNLKTAKALGLAIPPSILLRADEVIE